MFQVRKISQSQRGKATKNIGFIWDKVQNMGGWGTPHPTLWVKFTNHCFKAIFDHFIRSKVYFFVILEVPNLCG